MWQPCSCIMGLLSSALTTVCLCCSLFQPSHFGFFSNLGEWLGYHSKYAWGESSVKRLLFHVFFFFFFFFFFFEEALESCL